MNNSTKIVSSSSDVLNSAAISIDNVAVSYGKNVVIQDITFDVSQGQNFGLIGLNGVGKTTLIKAILGLRYLDQGVICIHGMMQNGHRAKNHVAYLPEKFEPPWFLKGIEFIEFTLKMYKKNMDADKAYQMAERLGLDSKAMMRRVGTYSKGMKQKTGLIATLMAGTDLIVLDEPMSGLDPRTRATLKDMFVEARDEGTTIFLSTHILSDINEICDRVGVIDSGTMVFQGTPAELMKAGNNKNLERAFLNVIAE